MASNFRSQEMRLCQMILNEDSAFSCLTELGDLGLVQFNNLNKNEMVQQLKFIGEVRRCSELERILKFLQTKINSYGLATPQPIEGHIINPVPMDLMKIETVLDHIQNELKDIEKNYDAMKKIYTESIETRHVLRKTTEFYEGTGMLEVSDSMVKMLLSDAYDRRPGYGDSFNDERKKAVVADDLKLEYLTGTIPTEKFHSFEKILWRVCRGNYYLKHSEIEEPLYDPVKGVKIMKHSFIIFFQSEAIKTKVKKICQGFGTVLHPCSRTTKDREAAVAKINTQMADLNLVMGQTKEHRLRILSAAAGDLNLWITKVRKMKGVYYIMNHLNMDESQKYFIAECWVPLADIPEIQLALNRGVSKVGSTIPAIMTELHLNSRTPPTYNPTNKFTKAFQMLIDAYGIGSYRELNPTPFTMVTFPFLFGVMFGDIGHGLLMTLFGLWMIWKEKALEARKSSNEIWNIMFGGRYIIFSMGLFSIYCGFIYNDFFAKSISLFPSHWRINYNVSTVQSNRHLQLDPATADYTQTPYIFGFDPVWGASGEFAIITENSFKMKLAIILGVCQMMFGLILSACNHIFFYDYVDLFLVFIPQILFMACLFVYLAFLIFLKWVKYAASNPPPNNATCAPSILIIFIDMILFKKGGGMEVRPECLAYIFSWQCVFQKTLVMIALASVPVLLFGKPIYFLRKRHLEEVRNRMVREWTRSRTASLASPKVLKRIKFRDDDEDYDEHRRKSTANGDLPMSEIFIHQGIQTIESVLGSVSHTASYLRLWALSLAHDQLSHVLWNMVLGLGLKSSSPFAAVILYFTFGIWSILTVSILVVMEGLSAFLHTLRLHWVEFQSKFYTGDGEKFEPFSFQKILEEDWQN